MKMFNEETLQKDISLDEELPFEADRAPEALKDCVKLTLMISSERKREFHIILAESCMYLKKN